MEIKRESYLEKLIKRRENGMTKVITGIRRCGKSYLLFKIFYRYLLMQGVDEQHIIRIALDDIANKKLRDALTLYEYIKQQIIDAEVYYIFLDEIQYVENFSDLINGLNHLDNTDVYVTGSNSRFLSTDILTEFRGRGDEIRVYPLSFAEFVSVYGGSLSAAWKDYYTYGGMPELCRLPDEEMKADYLRNLLQKVYLSDILEHNKIKNDSDLESLVNIIASAIGSLTNPHKLANSFKSMVQSSITDKTVKRYLDFLQEAFLVEKAMRYNIKGRKYIETTSKYYFCDVGLRNARLNFRQQEENHIMENIIYNELRIRGFSVDVGVVEVWDTKDGKKQHKQLEIDFIANKGSQRYYIQSAFEMSNHEKEAQETRSLENLDDSFKKFIILKDDIKSKRNEKGIITMGIFDFLLQADSLLY